MPSNPFHYTRPVSAADLVNRDSEASHMVQLAVEANNSRLVAPRRYGKTSLLFRLMADLPKGWIAVYVDFFGVLSADDVAQRIDRAYADQLTGRLASWFQSVRRTLRPTLRAGGGALPASVDVALSPPSDASLLDRLSLPRRVHERHGQRVLVVFDEFQDVLTAGNRIDAVIRSEIQHHGPAASYVFAGSQVGMMEKLFGDRRRAFYGQAVPISLAPLADVDLGQYIADRFGQTGKDPGVALRPLLDLASGHPQRAMLLAHAAWEATEEGLPADEEAWGVARLKAMVEVRDELRALWVGLPAGQRRVLTTLARGDQALYASRPAQGGSRGGAVRSALAALVDRGEVVGRRVVDPLLAAWVAEGTPDS